jgi:hypothetical protein
VSSEQQADDPSGPGWRDVEPDELLQPGDMFWDVDHWEMTQNAGRPATDYRTYRRRIEPQQPSDSETETMEDLRRRLAECEVLLAEYERGGQQVNAELQQLRKQLMTSQYLAEMSRRQVADEAGKVEQLKEQVATLTRELRAERDGMIGNLRSQNRLGQEAAVELIEAWLRPVVELMAEQPEDHAELAIVILGYLPQIASRLIEEEP